jgi:hypothetical protein
MFGLDILTLQSTCFSLPFSPRCALDYLEPVPRGDISGAQVGWGMGVSWHSHVNEANSSMDRTALWVRSAEAESRAGEARCLLRFPDFQSWEDVKTQREIRP